ncbi:AAA family ATPase [Neolewinella persica]|uniref:hypothetical protein n=1 Tax=Neolewinella persica TaxID=70998 RepID=UPI0012F7D91C|nr:hypothetical protein [Neolewinella persica]
MSNSLPFSSSTMTYTLAVTASSRHTAVRGAGKWTWALEQARKTLTKGGQVWIQAEAPALQKSITDWLKKTTENVIPDPGFGYEKAWIHDQIQPPAFGDYSLAATVGLWFKGMGTDAAALLSPFISTEGFSFTPKEFIDLRERLQTAIRRYERLPNVSRGLEDLNTGFFRHRSLEESQEFITERLSIYLNKGDDLHRDYLMKINRYTRKSIFSGRAQLRKRKEQLADISEVLSSAKSESGRVAKRARREAQQRWQEYHEEHKLTPAPDQPMEVQLNHELEDISKRQDQLFRDLQSAGLGLNSLTADPRFVDPTMLSSLETRLTDLIREVDEAGLYQLPLSGTEAATTHRQLLRLEGLLDKLRNTQRHLSELPDFYGRRHFWYAQPAHLRRLLAPLLNLPTSDWETAFTSWYFDRCIERWTKDHTPVLPASRQEAVDSDPNDTKTGRVVFVTAKGAKPGEMTEEDLFIALDAATTLRANLPCPSIRLAPLHDEEAVFVAVAGVRNPVLLFSQTFFPLTPPAWHARTSSIPPPGFPEGTILCQAANATEWIPISNWPLSASTGLHLFLPLLPTPADAQRLLEIWEYLISTTEEITFFHNWTPDDITQALLSDGFTAGFLSAALLRAAEAAEFEPFDRQALVALGQEILLRCGLPAPAPHPLAEHFGDKLKSYLPDHFFEIHQPWRDTFLPLVILSPTGKKSVLLPDGELPGHGTITTKKFRLRELQTAGFQLLSLPALDIWGDPEGELARIAEEVRRIG